uniref:Uncharacterized protein n=1 Tax=Rangifer tarandus platyrhynchus TaxID=3082113 RepID=A0ACB0F9D9_RANTA|nr:unnamed protein product [Rangifer tarandus platyrhynchus]
MMASPPAPLHRDHIRLLRSFFSAPMACELHLEGGVPSTPAWSSSSSVQGPACLRPSPADHNGFLSSACSRKQERPCLERPVSTRAHPLARTTLRSPKLPCRVPERRQAKLQLWPPAAPRPLILEPEFPQRLQRQPARLITSDRVT